MIKKIPRILEGCGMNHQQSFLKVRLSSPDQIGGVQSVAKPPARLAATVRSSRNAIVLF
jgi:hypothetical protein